MRNEKLIFDNRSSKPLRESYEIAFNCYYELWSEEQPNYGCTCGDFAFDVKTNKKSITIVIYDNDKKELLF